MLLRAASVVTLMSVLGSAEPLSQGDRDFAASQLHATRKLFLDTIAKTSERQWTYKPAPEVWSLAEIAEHIALAEQLLFNRAMDASKAPSDASKQQQFSNRQRDDVIVKSVPQRDQKFQAPEALKPSGKFTSRQAVIDAFLSRRDATIAYVLSTNDELRGHFLSHPMLGDMDAYQWVIYTSAHCERHINQMKELKARPDFPKQ